jgi:hypothetical protein
MNTLASVGRATLESTLPTHKRYMVSFSQSLAAKAYAQHPPDRFAPVSGHHFLN